MYTYDKSTIGYYYVYIVATLPDTFSNLFFAFGLEIANSRYSDFGGGSGGALPNYQTNSSNYTNQSTTSNITNNTYLNNNTL